MATHQTGEREYLAPSQPATPDEKREFSQKLRTASATLEILAEAPHIQPATARTLREVAYLCRANATR